ncbi:MAG: hypothetical protein R6X02_17190 [Enhygromyxa sp.]
MAQPGSVRRWIGALTALGLGTACSEDPCEDQVFEPPPEPEPSPSTPTLIAGEWIGAGVLELSFSRPLSSTGDLDPARFAIVGWDAISGYGCILSTNYRELGTSYYYYSPGSSIAAAWIGPEDDTRLRLRLSRTSSCLPSTNSVGSGVMLAYTDASSSSAGAKLLDQDGDPIGDIGPAWAIQRLDQCLEYNYFCRVNDFANGHLPALSSLVPIPCP